MSYTLDYDQATSPDDVYDLVSRGEYHSISSAINAQEGTNTYRIEIPAGVQNTGNAWVDVDSNLNTNSYGRTQDLWQDFWLYIPSDFQLNDTDHRFWTAAISYSSGDEHSGGGQPTGDNGWSVRLQLSDQGGSGYELIEYTYHMGSRIYNVHSAPITTGWNHFKTHVRCNTPGQTNGLAEVWVDGDLVFSTSGLEFTTTDSNMIEYGGPTGYYGGTPSRDIDLYFDSHSLSVNDDFSGGGTEPAPEPDVSYSDAVTPSGSGNEGLIYHESDGTFPGTTYYADFVSTDPAQTDFGFFLGFEGTGYDDMSGYFCQVRGQDGEMRLSRYDNGAYSGNPDLRQNINIPANEELTFEMDYRDTDSNTIRFALLNGDTTIDELSLSDSTYDSGRFAIYRWYPDNSWYLDSVSTDIQQLTVQTLYSLDVTENSATLSGDIEMQGYNEVEYYFNYRPAGGSWDRTDSATTSEDGAVEMDISGLIPGQEYDFRLIAEGESGGVRSFTTSQTGAYESFESGNLNHFEGDVSDFTVVSDNVRDGTYSLTSNTGHARMMAFDSVGPGRGETFGQSFYVDNPGDDILMLHFAVQADDQRYAIVADHSTGEFSIWVNNGGATWNTTDFDTAGTGSQWNEVIVDFGESQNDTINARYETADGDLIAEQSIQQNDFSTGGYGYSLWSDTASSDYRVDYLRQIEGEDPPEPEPDPDYQTDITVDANSQETVTFNVDYPEAGEYTYVVVANNMEESGTVNVVETVPAPEPPDGEDPPKEIRMNGSLWVRLDL